MNHLPIYGSEPPAFCFQSGDTANPAALIDCQICQERIDRRDEEAKQEHFSATALPELQANDGGSVPEGETTCR